MRISDWSSDVCSSDLAARQRKTGQLKKTAASKRAALPRQIEYTKAFHKDWERLSRSGRYEMNRLKEAMLLLVANDAPLGPERLDHRAEERPVGNECVRTGRSRWVRVSEKKKKKKH